MPKQSLSATDWPTYWFVRLERAVEDADYSRAAEAQSHLQRLGVEVRFRRASTPVNR